jgi:hypothetical protein
MKLFVSTVCMPILCGRLPSSGVSSCYASVLHRSYNFYHSVYVKIPGGMGSRPSVGSCYLSAILIILFLSPMCIPRSLQYAAWACCVEALSMFQCYTDYIILIAACLPRSLQYVAWSCCAIAMFQYYTDYIIFIAACMPRSW